nr:MULTISPECIES: UDP-N-acetylglucosamine 1-carboxyvinyltransferase [unclassified Ruminococcus]
MIIEGRKRLSGRVEIQGAKNSALPILAATLLTNDSCVINNCPDLSDVEITLNILRYLGCTAQLDGNTVTLDSKCADKYDIPDELMHAMRSSIIFLGPLLARFGKARLTFPGGCELGPRPIDLHLKALRMMGVEIAEQHGIIECFAPDGIKGAKISLSFPSVGATENIMIAAATAKGTTVITNAAREPEICDLADCLNSFGAQVAGAGEGTIVIDGVSTLKGAMHTIIPDRIAAATYMAAVAATGGKVLVDRIVPSHLSGITPIFEESGCTVKQRGNSILIDAPRRLRAVKLIRTMPYPGFPTDAQPPLMAMLALARGTGIFVENIFENRYKHTSCLERMGARIYIEGKVAVVEGVPELYGAKTAAPDLRGGAALVVAGLSAGGKTEINDIHYIERGYERIELALSQLGASIKKL